MKNTLLRFIAFFKGLVILLRPHLLLGFLRHPFLLVSNTLALSKWIAGQNRNSFFNDFYTPKRDYSKRYQLYQHVIETQGLADIPVDYLEFGVCGGYSFKWWVNESKNSESRFYGFDTFEGLPEDWGTFSKGDMAAGIPVIDDTRVEFLKGLFQETLPAFLANQKMRKDTRKVIHLDADLFSSTLYALTSLAPYLKKGDLLLFDEFNVPNHEFYAFKMFCDSYYVKTKVIGAVNNYFQVAMVIE